MTIISNTTIDQWSNIEAELDAKEAAGGGVVWLPEGDIISSGPIPARQFTHLRGASQDSTRLHFEGTWSDAAIDLKGPGPSGGTHPADRRYSGVSDMTILGRGLSSTSEASGVRLGYNHRSRNMLENIRITGFPGDGELIDADNWNIAQRDVAIDDCAYRKVGAAGFRKNPAVTDINFFSSDYLTVEDCGNPTTPGLSGGINIQTTTLMTNRSWKMRSTEAENNKGVVEAYFKNLNGLYLELYIEQTCGTVGAEFENVQGVLTAPDIHSAVTSGATKALKFYGTSNVVLVGYRRGSGWLTNDIEAANGSRITVVGGCTNLRVTRYDSSVVTLVG